MSEHIIISTENRVSTLTISRIDKKNAISQGMYAKMADALNDYAADDDVRAFVITGAGDFFTSGNDIADFATSMDEEGGARPPVARFLDAIRDCPKPVIAAVNGPGIGIGLTMLLHCDLVYAGEAATFGAPFVKLGVVPEAASSLLLPAAVGMAIANDILLAGRTLNAEEALKFGLIARIFPDAALLEEVGKIAAAVANASPRALKKSKSLIRSQRARIADHMATEAHLFVEQLNSPDFAESVAAMMQKRAPNYD